MKMPLDAWLPIGFELPFGAKVAETYDAGGEWQIVTTTAGDRALIATDALFNRWTEKGLIEQGYAYRFAFGDRKLAALASDKAYELACISNCPSPQTKAHALAFAFSLKKTRELDASTSLDKAIYYEKISRVLPDYSGRAEVTDDLILGSWLTGGLTVPCFPIERLQRILSWLTQDDIAAILNYAGLQDSSRASQELKEVGQSGLDRSHQPSNRAFALPGRPALEAFFNEHVIEIVENREHYKKLGIQHLPAIILEGPPGCGKTFAVEQLVKFLGWPLHSIDASSIASPYIHETSRKVANIFEKAIEDAPSVIVIDEMEAFLADRESGSGSSHHRVEEVAEFLRKIPAAQTSGVLIVGMTNRIEMIDPAILRRGRFDHIIRVDPAGEQEVEAMMSALLHGLPTSADVDIGSIAKGLAARPLSDVAFVVREGARLAAKAKKIEIDQESLEAAVAAAPARGAAAPQKVGFL
jgi:cell division protease FtsH